MRRLHDTWQYARQSPGRPPSTGTPVFSGRIANSIENILAAAAGDLGVELQYDNVPREARIRRVDLTVSRVTSEELVAEVLKDSGLEYELDDNRLLIRSKQ